MEKNLAELARETVKARGNFRLLKMAAGPEAGITIDAEQLYLQLSRELDKSPDGRKALQQAERESRENSELTVAILLHTALGQLRTALSRMTSESLLPHQYSLAVEPIKDERVRETVYRLLRTINRTSNVGLVLGILDQLVAEVMDELVNSQTVTAAAEARGETTH